MDIRKINEHTKTAQLNFILAELMVGQTFASMARLAAGTEAKTRSRIRARTAYNSAVHFVRRVTMNAEQWREIRTTMTSLRIELQALGETF